MVLKREKVRFSAFQSPWIPFIGCGIGAVLTAVGMIRGYNPLFIAGLALMIGGYIMIRQKLRNKAKRG